MMPAQSSLYCSVIGRGDPVVLVHGDGLLGNPIDHWWQQLTLADEYQLIMPARPGYYLSPLPRCEAFDVYAEVIAELLGEGAYLVGHSYGGVIALLAAAQRPEAVYSLTVSEPPAFGLVRGHAEVERFIARMPATPVPRSQMAPEAFFLHLYNALYGHTLQDVSQLPERVRAKLATPLGRLAATPFPKLVFSSGAIPMHEVVCKVLVHQLAAEHALIRGVVHVVPETGTPFNGRLRVFLSKARGEQMEA